MYKEKGDTLQSCCFANLNSVVYCFFAGFCHEGFPSPAAAIRTLTGHLELFHLLVSCRRRCLSSLLLNWEILRGGEVKSLSKKIKNKFETSIYPPVL